MTVKENAREIIRFGQPERTVTDLPCFEADYFGVNHQSPDDPPEVTDAHAYRPVGAKWRDIWHTEWHKEYPGVMGFPRGNPLADIDALTHYRWASPDDERICGRIYARAAAFHDKKNVFLSGSHRDTLWEKAYMLVGMENMMTYFYTEPDYARTILHHIMDFQLGIAAHYVNIGVEIVYMGDDLGTQSGLLLSPEIIREFLLPEYERLFTFYKKHGVLVNFHSCGHIEPLLETFIALGVDILNPVQATANDLRRVISITEGRMALMGGISTELLLNGPTEAIRAAVKDALALLGRRGGYFCGPDQYMPFPEENIQALRDAVAEYGKNPAV